MSSKIVISKSQIPIIQGTKSAIRNAQLLVSTGIPSLDHFIGGGLPVGTVLLIEEDTYNIYSNIALSYFIAEGVVNEHSLFVASQQSDPLKILFELPAVENTNIKVNNISCKNEAMKIAWRYQNMKIMDSSRGHNSSFGHYYDLSRNMDKKNLEKINIKLWDGENINCENNIFENKSFMDLLLNIKKTILQGKFFVSQTTEKRNILRIAIDSLGSRMWLSDSEAQTENDLLKFIYMLKSLLRQSFVVATITVPVFNFDNGIVEKLEHLSDVVIRLESFAGSSKAMNPVFKEYHGLLHIKKISAFNTLVNQDAMFTDLAFKLRRKKFQIEILHLPPKLGNIAEREQDEVIGSCYSEGKRRIKLDF